ncbi:hypothetical protein BKA67DRAFT_578718 [Truncatella angustata]|uniref:Uncharacterized protein n=1 Tax=Truncatella angustata TaxID=152316 RepID=A0A9P8RQW2_9PEZI|nr:uncharacterized protein BKA67DRAFT_578718 [Truncatella angustata]KAH6647832.1 hypothetical protein BKA67DRAFT_578718 [Truncatella angustata]
MKSVLLTLALMCSASDSAITIPPLESMLSPTVFGHPLRHQAGLQHWRYRQLLRLQGLLAPGPEQTPECKRRFRRACPVTKRHLMHVFHERRSNQTGLRWRPAADGG